MLRSFSFLRPAAGLLPVALLAAAACNNGSVPGGAGGSTSSTSTTSTASSTSTASTGVTGTGGGGGGSGGNGGSGGVAVIPDTTAPEVVSTFPAAKEMGVAANGAITATFTEAMSPLTINAITFSLKQGALEIPGTVTYFDSTATFHPTSDLALAMSYTATITTAATDLAGNKLAADYTWSFATAQTLPKGPAPVLLGASGDYVILAKSAVSNVPTSIVTGNLGLSPAAASFITGFSLTRVGTKWTAPQVIGSVFAADNDPPTPINLTTAILNMQTAYTDAAGRPTPDALNLGSGMIGGLTVLPGLYKWTTSVTISSDLKIAGSPNDVWIFQIAGDLALDSAKSMFLNGGAQARNVFWQVAGLVDIGTTSHAEGIILSKTSIKLGTGASINGRLLAQTSVNIDSSTVTAPTP
jgi:Ice-binding-like/Bacterial Ig-like domain